MVTPYTLKRGFEEMSLFVADPGTGTALPNAQNCTIPITIAAGATETNTLADPPRADLELVLVASSVGAGGTRTVTVATQYNTAGSTSIVLNAVQDAVVLRSVPIGTAFRWVATALLT